MSNLKKPDAMEKKCRKRKKKRRKEMQKKLFANNVIERMDKRSIKLSLKHNDSI